MYVTVYRSTKIIKNSAYNWEASKWESSIWDEAGIIYKNKNYKKANKAV